MNDDRGPSKPQTIEDVDVRTRIELVDLPHSFWIGIALMLGALADAVFWTLSYPNSIAVAVLWMTGGYLFVRGLNMAVNKEHSQDRKP